jgi:putative membrane protein
MTRITILAAALATFAAAPLVAQTTDSATYVAKAGAGDLYERTSSQLVLRSTKDPKIREFATMMIRDHAKSTADVKKAATAARVRVPAAKLEPAQANMVAELRAKTGAERDRTYVMQQQTAHGQALALHTGYAASGTAAPLKTVAAATAPVVQHHIEMLQGM